MVTADAGNPAFWVIDAPSVAPDRARYEVIPAPFERSTSYGHGAENGPRAILDASRQLEAFDGVDVPAEAGILTGPPVDCAEGDVETVLGRIGARVAAAHAAGRIPVMLGGEHTATLGAVRALRTRVASFGVVQFDAHGDLRDRYQDNAFSHACVMRRIAEAGLPLFQIGVRSLSVPEVRYRWTSRIAHLDADALRNGELLDRPLPVGFPETIYLTFDVDAFDPSLVPGTGTPEPGGLTWREAVRALAGVIAGRRVLGFDVVELAPIAGNPVSDFTAAKLVYTIMGLINRTGAGTVTP
jgi:agmatinase